MGRCRNTASTAVVAPSWSGGIASDPLGCHAYGDPAQLRRLVAEVLTEVLLGQQLRQRLVRIVEEFRRAADVHRLVRVVGQVDGEADPGIASDVAGLAAV